MWTIVAFLSVLSYAPAQAGQLESNKGQLELKNSRFTYGFLGQERKDSIFLPGDMVVLAFDIEGLKVKEDGMVRYSMGTKLFSHQKKKNVFEKDPQQMEAVNSLGGSQQPVYAWLNILPDMEPGDYTIRVDVKDLLGNSAEVKLERKFTVKKMEFGIVRPGLVYLPLGEEQSGASTTLAPPLVVPGQNLMLHFTTVGFTEAGEKNEPNISVQVVIQDETGKPVLAKPITGKATKYADEQYRTGKFIP